MFVVVCVYIWACEVSEAGPPKLGPEEMERARAEEMERVLARAFDDARREAINKGLDTVVLFISNL